MDFNKQLRLIGYYNKPNQTMHEETEFVEEATVLAELLRKSFISIEENKETDTVFLSIIKGNTVFILKDEDSHLFAFYPYKGIARITRVKYVKKDVTPVPLKYKSWFVPGKEIKIPSNRHNSDNQKYIITTSGKDFLVTFNNHTYAMSWDNREYISVASLTELLNSQLVNTVIYNTHDECKDCDGYKYNCDLSRCNNNCDHCGGRLYICNNRCFNFRHGEAVKLVCNEEKIKKFVEKDIAFLEEMKDMDANQVCNLLYKYNEQLEATYKKCQEIENATLEENIDINKLISLYEYFEEIMEKKKRLEKKKAEIANKKILTIYINKVKKYAVDFDDIYLKTPLLRIFGDYKMIIETTYNVVNDDLVEFELNLMFKSKKDRKVFEENFNTGQLSEVYLSKRRNGKFLVNI